MFPSFQSFIWINKNIFWHRKNTLCKHSGVNFINILCEHFLYESLLSSISLFGVWLWTNFQTKNARVKCWWNWHLFVFPLCIQLTLFVSDFHRRLLQHEGRRQGHHETVQWYDHLHVRFMHSGFKKVWIGRFGSKNGRLQQKCQNCHWTAFQWPGQRENVVCHSWRCLVQQLSLQVTKTMYFFLKVKLHFNVMLFNKRHSNIKHYMFSISGIQTWIAKIQQMSSW